MGAHDTKLPKNKHARQGSFRVTLFAALSSDVPVGIVAKTCQDDPCYLIVESIVDPSLIAMWNAVNHRGVHVKAGDAIRKIRINGREYQGDASDVCERLMTVGKENAEVSLEVHPWEIRNPKTHHL